MSAPRERPARQLPQLLIGLVALAVALAVAVPVTGVVVIDGIRDVKRTRDTIVVTGSAKQPIEANLAVWTLAVSAQKRTPAAAARALRAKVVAVGDYLRAAGVADRAVAKPPLAVVPTSVNVPTGLKKPAFRRVPEWRVSQRFRVTTSEIDILERAAGGVDRLLLSGVDVALEPLEYLSTELTAAKFAALKKATADAQQRAATIAQGLGGSLGAVRNVQLGVFQITRRNSTAVTDYGINDTSSREKDVTAVVTVTFAVRR